MLTNQGYDLPSFENIKGDMQDRFKNKFGDNANLADDSVLGMYIGIMSQMGYRGEELTNAVYNALFWKTSTGKNLDAKAADSGIYRKPASNSYVELTLKAIPTTLIPAGSQFSTNDGHIFKTIDDISIDNWNTYTDNNGFSVPYKDDDGNLIGAQNIQAISEETGANENVLPHTINYIDESIDGLVSVDNDNGAAGGSNSETDGELRNRGLQANIKSTKGTVDGLENAVLNVQGVTGIKPIPNKTLDKDEYGNPPKSLHIFVIGGDDNDVANAIFNQLYMTTQTVGNKAVEVKDLIGDVHTVRFDEAKTRPIYINIHLDVDDTTFNTDSAPEEIKNKVIDYFNTLTMGDSVLYSRLFAPAFSASGVTNVTVDLGTDPNNLSAANVDVDQFELPRINEDNIKIDWK